jgi:hypothetical protein
MSAGGLCELGNRFHFSAARCAEGMTLKCLLRRDVKSAEGDGECCGDVRGKTVADRRAACPLCYIDESLLRKRLLSCVSPQSKGA